MVAVTLSIIVSVAAIVMYASFVQRRRMKAMPKTLLQCTLATLTPSLLVQCQPILIYDRIVDPKTALPSTAFRWMHIPLASKHSHVATGSVFVETRSRYTLLWIGGRDENNNKNVIRIADKSQTYTIDIMLSQNQVLILPDEWRFSCPTATLDRYEMHGP